MGAVGTHYGDVRTCRRTVFAWLARYNTRRRHSPNGHLSPDEYEHRHGGKTLSQCEPVGPRHADSQDGLRHGTSDARQSRLGQLVPGAYTYVKHAVFQGGPFECHVRDHASRRPTPGTTG
jgi:hypothetical protein